MAQKKSKERPEEPLGAMSYQASSKRSLPFWLLIGARKLCFSIYPADISYALFTKLTRVSRIVQLELSDMNWDTVNPLSS